MSLLSEVPSDDAIVRDLVDDLPVGLWVARAPNGELIYANRMFAQIMGQGGREDQKTGAFSEPYGIFTRDGKPYPEDRLPFVRAMRERQLVVVDDITIRRPDGTRVDVRAFARPCESGGAITHVVIAFFDITREAEAEKRLHRAQRLEAIGTLAGGIAHDFNNLIFGIKLIASELAAQEQDAAKRGSLVLIDDATERAAMLTRSLLSFARRGRHHAALLAVDDVIAEMRDLVTRTLSGITLEFDLGGEHRGSIVGDRSQIEQIVMNLVINARDALQQSGSVKVTTRTAMLDALPVTALGTSKPGPYLVLEVADDGPGIPLDLRERVFEPYFTTKMQGADRGTGLGLATVLGIVESHHGAIEIDRGMRGRGTTMRVFLPAALQAADPAEPKTTSDIPSGTGAILVVDDDPLVRSAVAATMRCLGYEPIEAAGGEEAVALYERQRSSIRAVVLDMVMPHMGGRATFTALRQLEPSVRVVLMSGYALNEDVQALLDQGAGAFITKPYSAEMLARSLAQVLAS